MCSARTAAGDEDEQAAIADDQTPLSVLCVDDDPRVLKYLEAMLGQLGHSVTAVGSGREAVELLEYLISDEVRAMIRDHGYELP